MLVLSRRKEESVIIAGNVTVTVLEIRGDKVRLGIAAPRDVAVHRSEILEAMQTASAVRAMCNESAEIHTPTPQADIPLQVPVVG
jgi:carbon storage regulator